eukprot:365590-Chlamydomonas_euryale.AAC.4
MAGPHGMCEPISERHLDSSLELVARCIWGRVDLVLVIPVSKYSLYTTKIANTSKHLHWISTTNTPPATTLHPSTQPHVCCARLRAVGAVRAGPAGALRAVPGATHPAGGAATQAARVGAGGR